MSTDFQPFDWNHARMVSRRRLPHIEQDRCTYFVTFRLADSLPWDKVRQWKNERSRWLQQNPPPHDEKQLAILRQLVPERVHRYLDAGHGECVLARPEAQAILETVLRFGDDSNYELGDFVIMPNHVHVLVRPSAKLLHQIVPAWKSISSRRINAVLARSGQLWQEESFDHVLRSEERFAAARKYIRKNPARLAPGTYLLGCGTLT